MQGKQEVSVAILCESMLWDAIPADIDTHHGLLQQLSQSGDYCDERKTSIQPAINSMLTHVNDHFSKLTIGVDSRRSDFVWDEDMLSDLDTHGALLQLLACCKECMNDKKTKYIPELDVNGVLNHIGSSPLFLKLLQISQTKYLMQFQCWTLIRTHQMSLKSCTINHKQKIQNKGTEIYVS